MSIQPNLTGPMIELPAWPIHGKDSELQNATMATISWRLYLPRDNHELEPIVFSCRICTCQVPSRLQCRQWSPAVPTRYLVNTFSPQAQPLRFCVPPIHRPPFSVICSLFLLFSFLHILLLCTSYNQPSNLCGFCRGRSQTPHALPLTSIRADRFSPALIPFKPSRNIPRSALQY